MHTGQVRLSSQLICLFCTPPDLDVLTKLVHDHRRLVCAEHAVPVHEQMAVVGREQAVVHVVVPGRA
eukprot:5305532-Pyramimonas_sp.AAC.3